MAMLYSPNIRKRLDPSIQKYTRQAVPDGFAVLYAIVRHADNKSYIGQSTNSARKRMKTHMRDPRSAAIHAALKKHGARRFRFVILAVCPEAQADDLEVELIAKHGTQGKGNGYNILEGGRRSRLPPEVVARVQAKRKITMATDQSVAKRSASAKVAHASLTTQRIRQTASHERMLKEITDATAAAVPVPPPHMRQHGAYYIREDEKVYRYYVPKGRGTNRGNFKEVSIAAISKKRTESVVRMRAKRGGFESQGVHK